MFLNFNGNLLLWSWKQTWVHNGEGLSFLLSAMLILVFMGAMLSDDERR